MHVNFGCILVCLILFNFCIGLCLGVFLDDFLGTHPFFNFCIGLCLGVFLDYFLETYPFYSTFASVCVWGIFRRFSWDTPIVFNFCIGLCLGVFLDYFLETHPFYSTFASVCVWWGLAEQLSINNSQPIPLFYILLRRTPAYFRTFMHMKLRAHKPVITRKPHTSKMAVKAYQSGLALLATEAGKCRAVRVNRPRPISKGGIYYEVEDVLEKRFGANGVEYFVSWVGYSTCNNMWIDVLPEYFEETWGWRNDPKSFNMLVESAINLLTPTTNRVDVRV
jgi:F0F1-type ATP synthase assembly protein I